MKLNAFKFLLGIDLQLEHSNQNILKQEYIITYTSNGKTRKARRHVDLYNVLIVFIYSTTLCVFAYCLNPNIEL